MLGCTRDIEKLLQARLAVEFGSTLPRFDVLAALDRHPEGLTMGALAATLRVSNGNTTGVVRRLEEDGYVTRTTQSNDRRTAVVRLTPAGRTAFATMAAAHEAWVDDLFASLPAAELEALASRFAALRLEINRFASLVQAESDDD
jgi:DNA-binding MarR family transcriptional regulator